MTISDGRRGPVSEEQELRAVSNLLGGERVFGKRHRPRTHLEAHEALVHGLPGKSIGYLFDNLVLLHWETSIERAIGMSLRTFQRLKSDTKRPLSYEQSSRAWKFAEVLAKATSVLGTQEEAEQWLARPAMGLDGRRPIDLLATQTGTELVEQFLERLDHGVYV